MTLKFENLITDFSCIEQPLPLLVTEISLAHSFSVKDLPRLHLCRDQSSSFLVRDKPRRLLCRHDHYKHHRHHRHHTITAIAWLKALVRRWRWLCAGLWPDHDYTRWQWGDAVLLCDEDGGDTTGRLRAARAVVNGDRPGEGTAAWEPQVRARRRRLLHGQFFICRQNRFINPAPTPSILM